MLGAPGWGKHDNSAIAIKRNYIAGKILAERLPDIPELPEDILPGKNSSILDVRVFEKARDARDTAKAPEFELEDKMVEVCVTCMKHFITEGRTPPGDAMIELIDNFKLIDL